MLIKSEDVNLLCLIQKEILAYEGEIGNTKLCVSQELMIPLVCNCVSAFFVSRVMSPKHKHGEILDSFKCIFSASFHFFTIFMYHFSNEKTKLFFILKNCKDIYSSDFLSVLNLRCYSKQQIKQCVNTKSTHCRSKVL